MVDVDMVVRRVSVGASPSVEGWPGILTWQSTARHNFKDRDGDGFEKGRA